MALSPLSRSSVASSFAQRPSAVDANSLQGVKGGGLTAQLQGLEQLVQQLQSLLKQLGVNTGPVSAQGAQQAQGAECPKQQKLAQQQQQFRQDYQKDSFEPAKTTQQARSPQLVSPPPPPAQTQTQDAKGSASGKSADQVAQTIAKDATSWTYDYTGGKSWDAAMGNAANFDKTKSGVCVDMAIEAEQRFEKEGVDAHVVFGNTAEGLHAWVEFKDDGGKWQAFDPTAAACTKKADDAITPYDGGPYHYQGVTETHEAVA